MLLESVTGARLTSELFQKWMTTQEESVQLHSKGTVLAYISLPQLAEDREPEILNDPVETLRKSSVLYVVRTFWTS
jgi:hypothetical protein